MQGYPGEAKCRKLLFRNLRMDDLIKPLLNLVGQPKTAVHNNSLTVTTTEWYCARWPSVAAKKRGCLTCQDKLYRADTNTILLHCYTAGCKMG